jgi:hypothetical protein
MSIAHSVPYEEFIIDAAARGINLQEAKLLYRYLDTLDEYVEYSPEIFRKYVVCEGIPEDDNVQILAIQPAGKSVLTLVEI